MTSRRAPRLARLLAAGRPARPHADRAVRRCRPAVLVVSFRDYDRVGIYPAFMLDNYRDLFTTPATGASTPARSFAVIVWAVTLFLGFNIAQFLVFHVRSGTVRTDAVPRLRHPVLDLGHHPHDRLDPVPGPQRRLQPDADGPGITVAAARFPAVLRFRGRHRLRPPQDAADGGADRQLDVQDRPRRCSRRRATPAPAGSQILRQRSSCRCRRPASRSARSWCSPRSSATTSSSSA